MLRHSKGDLFRMKVDFHCHTTASDGHLTPEKLVDLALEQQVEWLAITDHDTTAGYQKVKKYAENQGLRLTSGVEVSVLWQGRTIHIVGLNMDVEHLEFQAMLQEIREIRWQRLEQINQKLMKRGHPCLLERAKELVGEGVAGRPHVAEILVERQYVKTVSQAFDKFLKPGRSGFAKAAWPPLEKAVQLITEAGGIAVVAHPGQYKLTSRKLNLLLTDFKEAGGQGLEVVTSPHRTSESVGMADRAKRYDFYASLGSDFHSPEHKWRNLGWLAELPEGVKPICDVLNN